MAGPPRPEDSPEADEPEVVSEEEAPEDDFFEADASAELTEDEDDQVEEYASDDEEVSLDAISIAHIYCSCPAVDFVRQSELDESVLPPSKIFNYDEVVHLFPALFVPLFCSRSVKMLPPRRLQGRNVSVSRIKSAWERSRWRKCARSWTLMLLRERWDII